MRRALAPLSVSQLYCLMVNEYLPTLSLLDIMCSRQLAAFCAPSTSNTPRPSDMAPSLAALVLEVSALVSCVSDHLEVVPWHGAPTRCFAVLLEQRPLPWRRGRARRMARASGFTGSCLRHRAPFFSKVRRCFIPPASLRCRRASVLASAIRDSFDVARFSSSDKNLPSLFVSPCTYTVTTCAFNLLFVLCAS